MQSRQQRRSVLPLSRRLRCRSPRLCLGGSAQRKIRLREKLGGRGDGMAGPRGRVFEGAAPVTATEKETSSRFVTPCACLITKYFENAKKGRRVGFSAVSSSLSLPPCRRVVCAVLIRCRWFSSKKLQTLFLESLCALTTFENIRLLRYIPYGPVHLGRTVGSGLNNTPGIQAY